MRILNRFKGWYVDTFHCLEWNTEIHKMCIRRWRWHSGEHKYRNQS